MEGELAFFLCAVKRMQTSVLTFGQTCPICPALPRSSMALQGTPSLKAPHFSRH